MATRLVPSGAERLPAGYGETDVLPVWLRAKARRGIPHRGQKWQGLGRILPSGWFHTGGRYKPPAGGGRNLGGKNTPRFPSASSHTVSCPTTLPGSPTWTLGMLVAHNG